MLEWTVYGVLDREHKPDRRDVWSVWWGRPFAGTFPVVCLQLTSAVSSGGFCILRLLCLLCARGLRGHGKAALGPPWKSLMPQCRSFLTNCLLRVLCILCARGLRGHGRAVLGDSRVNTAAFCYCHNLWHVVGRRLAPPRLWMSTTGEVQRSSAVCR
jgi:hypothetical protein